MFIDWSGQKIDEVYYDRDIESYCVVIKVSADKSVSVSEMVRTGLHRGIQRICRALKRDPRGNIDQLIGKHLERFSEPEIFSLDLRPICGSIKVFCSIRKENLNQLRVVFRDDNLGEKYTFEGNHVNFRDQMRTLVSILDLFDLQMRNDGHRLPFQVPSIMRDLISISRASEVQDFNQKISIFWNREWETTKIELDGKEARFLAGPSLLTAASELEKFNISENTWGVLKDTRISLIPEKDWRAYFSKVFPDSTPSPTKKKKTFARSATEIGKEYLDVARYSGSYEKYAESTWFKIKEEYKLVKEPLRYTRKCSSVGLKDAYKISDYVAETNDLIQKYTSSSQDVKTLGYKLFSDVELERAVTTNPVFRADWMRSGLSFEDFVGDSVIESLFGNRPRSLEEIYDKLFNKVNFNTLLAKTIACLVDDIDLSGEIDVPCLEVYRPFVIDIFGDFVFPSLTSFLTDLLKRLLYALLSETVFFVFDKIINYLEECARKRREGEPDNPLIMSDDLTADFLKEYSKNGSDTMSKLKEMLSDLSQVLTLSEFCLLVRGSATEEIFSLVRCLLEKKYASLAPMFSTNDAIQNFFVDFGVMVDADFCDREVMSDVPDHGRLCLTADDLMLRQAVADLGVSEENFSQQMLEAKDRRRKEIKFLSSMLSGGPIEGMTFDSKEKMKELIPLVSDLPELERLLRGSIRAIIDSALNMIIARSRQIFREGPVDYTGMTENFIFMPSNILTLSDQLERAWQSTEGSLVTSRPAQTSAYCAEAAFAMVQHFSRLVNGTARQFLTPGADLDEQARAQDLERLRGRVETFLSSENFWDEGINVVDGIMSETRKRETLDRENVDLLEVFEKAIEKLYIRGLIALQMIKISPYVQALPSRSLFVSLMNSVLETSGFIYSHHGQEEVRDQIILSFEQLKDIFGIAEFMSIRQPNFLRLSARIIPELRDSSISSDSFFDQIPQGGGVFLLRSGSGIQLVYAPDESQFSEAVDIFGPSYNRFASREQKIRKSIIKLTPIFATLQELTDSSPYGNVFEQVLSLILFLTSVSTYSEEPVATFISEPLDTLLERLRIGSE